MTTAYVAGASAEYLRTRSVVTRLLAAGVEVVYDWTTYAPEYLGREAELPALQRLTAARASLQSTRECDVFVLLVPEPPLHSIGAWVELGTALEARRRRERPAVVVAGAGAQRTIFTDLADVCCETDDEAVAAAVALASTFAGR